MQTRNRTASWVRTVLRDMQPGDARRVQALLGRRRPERSETIQQPLSDTSVRQRAPGGHLFGLGSCFDSWEDQGLATRLAAMCCLSRLLDPRSSPDDALAECAIRDMIERISSGMGPWN